jgi:hypothetical protein
MSKIGFSQEKSCKKIHDFHFCLIIQPIPIFPSKITTATFFGEFRLGLLSNNLGKTSSIYPKIGGNVIQLPEKREKRQPVTRKLGETSSDLSLPIFV